MIDYANNKIIIDGCYSCAFSEHKFSLPCGMVYENENFTISQDWELPIVGFMIVCPKRHIESFSELSADETNELFNAVRQTVIYLKELEVCSEFDVVVSEKQGKHFHIWISPKHKWEIDLFKSPTKHFDELFDYAKKNLKTPDNLKEIDLVSKKLKTKFEEKFNNL